MRFPIKITDNFIVEPIMHTFGAKAETSYVEISDGKMEVRMGIWFHETFPLASITQIATSDWPWWGGLGVKLHHHGVGVVASLDGVVNIQLSTPFKVNVVVSVECSQLWISLEDRDLFLKTISEARKIPISAHVKF